jgi:hypothetical protein
MDSRSRPQLTLLCRITPSVVPAVMQQVINVMPEDLLRPVPVIRSRASLQNVALPYASKPQAPSIMASNTVCSSVFDSLTELFTEGALNRAEASILIDIDKTGPRVQSNRWLDTGARVASEN